MGEGTEPIKITKEDLSPGDQVGWGREKTVHYRGDNPASVGHSEFNGDLVKKIHWGEPISNDGESVIARKRTLARYYEAKIAHLLFPDNFPDVHGARWSKADLSALAPSELYSDFIPGTHKKETGDFSLFMKLNRAGIYVDQDNRANAGNVIERDDGRELFTDIQSIYPPNILRYIARRKKELSQDNSESAKLENGRLDQAKNLVERYQSEDLARYSVINSEED
ncbi:MAG TPA: hypothetical protein PK263_01425 [bacterium]|nr:hypothetical protein [bacterium]